MNILESICIICETTRIYNLSVFVAHTFICKHSIDCKIVLMMLMAYFSYMIVDVQKCHLQMHFTQLYVYYVGFYYI